MAEDWQACRRQVEVARQRRLSAKITPTRTHLAGQAGPLVDFRREIVELARQAGAKLDEVEGQEGDG